MALYVQMWNTELILAFITNGKEESRFFPVLAGYTSYNKLSNNSSFMSEFFLGLIPSFLLVEQVSVTNRQQNKVYLHLHL